MCEKLKKLRLKSGLTQAQLAEKLNVSPSTVGMYEQGRREPRKATLQQVCRELNTSGDYILDLEDEKEESDSMDLTSIVNQFSDFIEKEKNIMINGIPVDNQERRRLSQALKVATAVVIEKTKERKSK